jgi:hypothetical protein
MTRLKLVFRDSLKNIRAEMSLVDLPYSTTTDIMFSRNKAMTYYNYLEGEMTPSEYSKEMRRIDEAIYLYASVGLDQHWSIRSGMKSGSFIL